MHSFGDSGCTHFLRKRFLIFGRNSGIHGLGHLFRENENFLVRLFWLVILLASSGCLYLLLMPVVEQGSEVSYTLDTRYLDWETTFPGVTVCEAYVPKTVQSKLEQQHPELMGSLSYDFKRYLSDLMFGRGTCKKSLCVPCGPQVACDVPWRKIVDETHKTCGELISNCSFNAVEFQCCKLFREVDSEHGPCYALNSLQSENPDDEPMFIVNRTTGPGVLSFRVLSDAQISVHSIEELATNYLDSKLKFDVRTYVENWVEFLFSVVDFETDPMLEDDDIDMRGCRYHDEVPSSPMHSYLVYSYSACRLGRETEDAFNHCGCVHPVRDRSLKKKYCNFTGISCWMNYASQKLILNTDKKENEDDCLPSCEESELTTIHITRRWEREQSGIGSVVNIRMASLPTLRYQRNQLRSDLDLVVSVGGMAGLFFSASILSIAEIFYLFLRKPNNE